MPYTVFGYATWTCGVQFAGFVETSPPDASRALVAAPKGAAQTAAHTNTAAARTPRATPTGRLPTTWGLIPPPRLSPAHRPANRTGRIVCDARAPCSVGRTTAQCRPAEWAYDAKPEQR